MPWREGRRGGGGAVERRGLGSRDPTPPGPDRPCVLSAPPLWPRSLGLRWPRRKGVHSGSNLQEAWEVTAAELVPPDLAASQGPCGLAEAGASECPVRPCQPLPAGRQRWVTARIRDLSPKAVHGGTSGPTLSSGKLPRAKPAGPARTSQQGWPLLHCVPGEHQNHGTARGLTVPAGRGGARRTPAGYEVCSNPRAPEASPPRSPGPERSKRESEAHTGPRLTPGHPQPDS